ncbi:MAG TPA: hypothetical protein VIK69_10290, partial [Methylophilaceae bacterium]
MAVTIESACGVEVADTIVATAGVDRPFSGAGEPSGDLGLSGRCRGVAFERPAGRRVRQGGAVGAQPRIWCLPTLRALGRGGFASLGSDAGLLSEGAACRADAGEGRV